MEVNYFKVLTLFKVYHLRINCGKLKMCTINAKHSK